MHKPKLTSYTGPETSVCMSLTAPFKRIGLFLRDLRSSRCTSTHGNARQSSLLSLHRPVRARAARERTYAWLRNNPAILGCAQTGLCQLSKTIPKNQFSLPYKWDASLFMIMTSIWNICLGAPLRLVSG